ncbi:Accessory gene regulator protein B [Paenibacillus plantiphilus]|uniref:Accessory gene regulator protein B n=1 Tax=Paenibacillus plantiphilus TaxID=2905650 RepID=A0ABM9C174_9BACL|nr:accessory gene regulator B family protein [Paenibacillus plantiphilus]CAH1200619.1 Accessory gene regulator protein B [Paenibacillus plantiphilus]
MNWSRKLANNLAVRIHSANPHHSVSLPVQSYAIETIIVSTIITSVALLIGLLLEQALEVLSIIIVFPLLRFITGGRHFSSPTACIATTVIGFNVVPILAQYVHSTTAILILTIGSLLLCIIYAPQGNRAIVKQHQIIKLAGGAIIAVNFIVMSPVLAIAFFLQAVTLIQFRKGG